MSGKDTNTTNDVVKHRKTKKRLSPVLWFIVIAMTAAIGYFAGVNHYQIEAAIGPVFGYKSHSGYIDLSSVQETYSTLAANFDGKLDVSALIDGANKGLVAAAGDDYTLYMTAKEAADYADSLSGDIGGGIGAVIGLKNSQTTIVSVLDNNPAKAAGLIANDIVLKINDESTVNMTVDQAVALIRGDEGTTVKLNIQRGSEIKDYVVTRAIINNPSVKTSIENGIGTMTIIRFDEQTSDLAKAAAENFISKGVKAVILDLRDNPGGYVTAAQDVAGLWLKDKTIVTERSDGIITETLKSGNNATLSGIPTVVLVNGNSASASEIVAGALGDYDAAKIIGEKTFGKGTVQNLISLKNGGELKVTIARWYTPKGKNITKEGITPDMSVSLTEDDFNKGIDPQMEEALGQLGF